MKKPAGLVRFRFYKQKTKKTEPNRNRKKPEKTEPNRKTRAKPKKTKKTEPKPKKPEPNRFEPVFSLKNRTETSRFDPVSVRFRFFFSKKINFGLVTFFYKNQIEPKMITPADVCASPPCVPPKLTLRCLEKSSLVGGGWHSDDDTSFYDYNLKKLI